MRKIFIIFLLLAVQFTGMAQTFMTPGNYTWVPPIGTASFSVTEWGGGGAGFASQGGGGSSYTRTKFFNLDTSSTPIQLYVGRGGYNLDNGSSDGENSWFIAPSGFVVNSGYGLSNGTTFTYQVDNIYRDVVRAGGRGGTSCPLGNAGGGGGGSPSSSGVVSGGTNATNCTAGNNAIPGRGGDGIGLGGNGGKTFGQLPAATNGRNPGGGGGSGAEATSGGNGMVVFTLSLIGTPGIIAQPFSIPFPSEGPVDTLIRSIAQASGYNPGGNSIIYRWEYSIDNMVSWNTVPGINKDSSYKRSIIDSVGYHYRRIATNTVSQDSISNVVKLKVFSKYNIPQTVNTPAKNGSISGNVFSRNGTGIFGIKVYAQKLVGLKSSPQSHIDSVVTGNGGGYQFLNLYYGDKDAPNNDPVNVSFKVWPAKPLNTFNPDTIFPLTLSFSSIGPLPNNNFTNTTVLSITGRIFQQCKGCLNANTVVVDTVTAGVDSAKIAGGDIPVYSPVDDGSGVYAASVQDPGQKIFTPSFSNHKFNPPFSSILVNDNVSGLNFEDTTTRVISGKLTAGCNDFIGTAVLEFTDVLPNDNLGNPRLSRFRKRVTTNAVSGTYSIRLPARKYKAAVISFAATSNVSQAEVRTFFASTNFERDITERDTTLNLVYQRPPVIELVGLNNDCAGLSGNTTDAAFVVIPQSTIRQFLVKVY